MRAFLVIVFSLALFSALAFAEDWPSFRGPDARGVADGQDLPSVWRVEDGHNLGWKARVPGLAHSSPIVWGDRVYVTTAVSSAGDNEFTPGLYGEGTASADRSVHQWKVYAFDATTGDVVWERVAYEGVPKEKRHIKATYANATPATNGEAIVAFFGSQGLYALEMDGTLRWKRDFGHLDTGAYDAPDYEWGTASSPILYQDLVIVQMDTQGADSLVALDVSNGETVWSASRDEMPSWATPNVYRGEARVELVTNAPNFIRGNDPRTGEELWRLGGSSNITAPTPVFHDDLIVVVSGRRPVKPIYVIRAGASGDITLDGGETASDDVVWSVRGRGSYMPSPLIYRDRLYILQNQGILDAYELRTGKEIYRSRVPHRGSGFSASPVAADGRIYLSSEDGDVFVVKAGDAFEVEATNSMGEHLMATPAVSGGMMFIRAHHHLFAVGRPKARMENVP